MKTVADGHKRTAYAYKHW